MAEWDAEFIVDEALARRLIAGQCFEPRTLRPFAEGWDNAVWLVDERWAFRFPRRQIAIPGVLREIAVLGELAPQVPLAIPVPRFLGEPADGFPWPFFATELIPGRELLDVALTDGERNALGRPLGEFLRALHGAQVSAELPDDPMGRSDMARRVPRTIELLRKLDPLWSAPPPVYEVLDAASQLPPVPAIAVVHCDLHFRHVLLDQGRPSGVIDWGDICRGDPSMDLALCWFALTPAGRADFVAAYGAVSESQMLGGRVLAFSMCATLALSAPNDTVLRAALAGLERAT